MDAGRVESDGVARRLLASAALVALLMAAVPAAAKAVSVDNGGRADRTVQAVQWGASAACRTPLRAVSDSAPEQCAVIDGRPVSEAEVNAYQSSWTHRALSLQRSLGAGAPLVEEQLVHTHNSFNASSYSLGSTSYYPTVTNQDPNQVYSLTDQLRMDVRALEIDVHWVPSPFGNASTGGFWVTMCHGDSSIVQGVHVGCSWDRPFQDGLAELKAWLNANPHEVILLYLENQLDDVNGPNAQAHQIAGQLIASGLGSLVYRPPAGQPCAPMPMDTVGAADILKAGHQVLIVGNCGPGAWGTWVWERGPRWDEHGDPSAYNDAACAADRKARLSDATFRRFFEDSTWLTAMQNGKNSLTTPAGAARMMQCGVNIVGLDQLTPQDPRLPALVWSWAQNEPVANAGNCAYQGADGRFHAGNCGDTRQFACVDSTGAWHVTPASGPWAMGTTLCSAQFSGSHFAVPPNGLRNQLIVEAKGSPSTQVWLNYANVNGTWTPTL